MSILDDGDSDTQTPHVRPHGACHIVGELAWRGRGVLALAVAGLASHDTQLVRAAYLATELVTWFVIVPLAFGSLLTGLVVSLGTRGACSGTIGSS